MSEVLGTAATRADAWARAMSTEAGSPTGAVGFEHHHCRAMPWTLPAAGLPLTVEAPDG